MPAGRRRRRISDGCRRRRRKQRAPALSKPLQGWKSRTRPHYSEMTTLLPRIPACSDGTSSTRIRELRPKKHFMAFNILGMNHKTAPVALREKVAFSEDRLVAALRTLRQEAGVAEAVILSTCNRTEVYWAGSATAEELSRWLERHHGSSLDLTSSLYVHQEQHAVEHAFNVASGLDSMVLGEAQILGQLKNAYRIAQETGSTGPILNKLFQAAFSAAKRVRSETRIGANAVSLASATVSLARRVYADLSAHNALLIGAGDMNALTARHFISAGIKRMVIANRTLGRAQALASELQAHAVSLSDLDKELARADIVISCTASPEPLVSKRAVEAATHTRRRRPIFMVDMAV